MAKKKSDFAELFKFATSEEEIKAVGEYVSTGSLKFDIFLNGGYRCGLARFGAFSEHGKSAQGLTWAREWLMKYPETGIIIYIDAEARMTYEKVSETGITDLPHFKWNDPNAEDLDFEDPETFNGNFLHLPFNEYDKVADYITALCRSNAYLKPKLRKRFFFVFDSLDAFILSTDVEKSFSQPEKIGAAQTISATLAKKTAPYTARYGHHFHVLSQMRANINTTNPNSPKTKMSGGNAILHASNLTGEIKKDWSQKLIYENPTASTKELKGKVIGRIHVIYFHKTFNNKTHQTLEIPILYGKGVWLEAEIIDVLLSYGGIIKTGATCNLAPHLLSEIEEVFGGKKGFKKKFGTELKESWRSYRAAVNYLMDKKELADWLNVKCREMFIEEVPYLSESSTKDEII